MKMPTASKKMPSNTRKDDCQKMATKKQNNQNAEFFDAVRMLEKEKGISFVEMDEKDIVRHKLVTRIVNAYHKYESEKKYPLFNDNKSEESF